MDRRKDPEAVLDWAFDWRNPPTDGEPWLEVGEDIADYTVTVADGLTLDNDSEDDGVVTVWLSGGTLDRGYDVTCHIVTTGGREDDRTIRILVRKR